MGKLNTPSVDTGRQAKIFAQLFFIIPLSGALLIDIRMPGIQLTVNMIFLIFASEYVLRVQRVGGGNMTLLWEPVSQKLQSIEDSEPVNPLLFYGLTVSEMEVAELVLQGKTAPEIAEELGRKTGAIHQHMSHIYRKTNTRSAQEFVVKMLRNPSEFGENSENSEI
jgi:DNA-binding CsgD family transcriptional regulator